MEEQLVSLPTAKLLKEKGFNEKCFKQYNNEGRLERISHDFDVVVGPYEQLLYPEKECYPAVEKSLAQKWLREKHNIHFGIWYNGLTNKWRVDYIINFGAITLDEWYPTVSDEEYSSYEEALEEALIEILKLIK